MDKKRQEFLRSPVLTSVAALLLSSCLSSMTKKLEAASTPEWATYAQDNEKMGDAAYHNLVRNAPRRGVQETISVFCTWHIPAPKLAENSSHAQQHEARILRRSARETVQNTASYIARESAPRGVTLKFKAQTQIANDWFEAVNKESVAADVYVSIAFHPLEGAPAQEHCPETDPPHAWRVSATWSSAYIRQDQSLVIHLCPGDPRPFVALLAEVAHKVHTEVRHELPAHAEALRLTPPIRYQWYLAKKARQKSRGHHSWDD